MKVVVTPKTTASYDFTNYQIETLLYTIEGYMQGNDDNELVEELDDICYRINKKLEAKV